LQCFPDSDYERWVRRGHATTELDAGDCMEGGHMKNWCAVLAIIFLAGCGSSELGEPSSTPTQTATVPATATPTPLEITVHFGESIQAAIDSAPANTTIFVEPGVYHESAGMLSAVTISKDGIQLIAQPAPDNPVVLENAGSQKNGIVVAPADSTTISTDEDPGEHPPCGENGNTIGGFMLEGFTVRGFDQFGVYLACVDGFALTENFADTNQLYALFPVRSHNGMVTNNEAQNTSLDSAIYIGQSDHVTVSWNSSHGNLLGLEIENSSDITVMDNDLFNNTLGLIADIMPGLQKTDQVNVLIADNDIHDNNLPNTATEGETGLTPPGTGMVILGGSMVTAQNNTVTNNDFAGIIVASYCTGTPPPCTNLDIDPNPEQNRIVNNDVSGNGSQPPADPIEAALAADLVWDHTGTGNCWAGNTAAATVKVLGGAQQLPACQ
jgi:parallel beta-helix repeat protein